MGAYLSEPNKEKQSIQECFEHLTYGASSMQGWRTTQEDAHNCIPEFDENTSLFAVYDGHGGAEVAQYCALHLPNYIKSTPTYKTGNLAQALEDSFLGFDELLTRDNIIEELKQMIGVTDQQSDDEEDEIDHLFAEANMPLSEVLAKYQKGDISATSSNPYLSHLTNNKPLSPCLRAARNKSGVENTNEVKESIKTDFTKENDDIADSADVVNGECDNDVSKETVKKDNVEIKSEIKATTSDSSVQNANGDDSKTSSTTKDQQPGCSSGSVKSRRCNRKFVNVVLQDDSEDMSDSEDENYTGHPGEVLDSEEDDDEEEEEDEDEGIVDESTMEEEDSDDDDDDEEDDNAAEEDDDDDDPLLMGKEEPGTDSGCTAVVALLRGDELYVANAGDSRCVVCRNGKAIDMSVDHKPEDELEKKRIENAGGEVTEDRRVNGGLNLSRAIGDHTYKRNPNVAPKDQMISALPDIRTLTIDPTEDEFMVLACDGIWNSMSSQEVVDFVREQLKENPTDLSGICEKMFDNCLAPHTKGDGTGCDNMTAIVIKFNKDLVKVASRFKRERDTSEEQLTIAKRLKADESANNQTLEVQKT